MIDLDTTAIKVAPFSLEAEQAVLGGLMLDDTAYDRVADRIGEEDFYRREHRLVFRAISALKDQGQHCDAVTLAEWLKQQGLAQDAGGLAFLLELVNNTPSAANIQAYADIVRDRAMLRQLLDAGAKIVDSVYNPEGRGSAELLELAEQQVYAIAEQRTRTRGDFQPVTRLLAEAYRLLEARYNAQTDVTGLATGFTAFDQMTSGLQPTDLIIVAARPSMGKTAFAMNIAERAALEAGAPVAVFSMEMSAPQLVLRMISSLGRIGQDRLRTGKLLDEEWPKITSTVSLLKTARLYVDDTPALSPAELRARARRLKREQGLSLIVVDYLQLMQVPGTRENRATEISEISRQLKALAKELAVPVVALSQLNRDVEKRQDKRPMMSDLRESGSIEQDADLIVFLYRDEYYNKDSADRGVAEVIIGKQRNGPTGSIKLKFWGQYTRFDNLAREPFVGQFE